MKSSGAYIKCESTVPFAEGDLISIVATPTSTSTDGVSLRLTNNYQDEAVAVIKANGKSTQQTLKDTIEAGSKLIGKNFFYVFTTNGTKPRSHYYESITVTSAFPANNTVTLKDMEYATYSNPTYSVDFTDSSVRRISLSRALTTTALLSAK